MTTFAWPTTAIFHPSTQTLRQEHNNRVTESPQSGYMQTASSPGARWGWILDMTPHETGDRAVLEAFITALNGQEHRVQLWDMKRPRPRGTCNLTGVTIDTAGAAVFTESIPLAGCGVAKTLLAGDWLGLPTGQLVMVAANATSDGGGFMTVPIRHMLRAAVTFGGAVVLDRPVALYINTSSRIDFPRQGGWAQPPVSFEFREVFA
jgi:hypothetical protein